MKIRQQAITTLSNNMRRYVEANLNFAKLKHVDLEEAIDNLDRAFEAKVEGFHSLYDVDKNDFDYFAHPDTALIIVLRNALHHRDHEIFRSWNADMYQDGGPYRFLGAEFLLAAHYVNNAPRVAGQFYKLQDFFMRIDPALSSPALERRMGDRSRRQILQHFSEDLGFKEILLKAEAERYPLKQIYINVVPIFISATCRVFKSLKQRGMKFEGFDASAYEHPVH
ncbi:hypothetical protein [Ensifer adhaerens]|uniref:hypothetical protein n=1 Tax=Ensifer adhaerens TaxID=106592 RepID=UPI001FEDB0F3|nr:hypothetical protein [Ensifer adhaerens]